MDANDIDECRDLCSGYLASVAEADWSSSIPDLEFTVSQVVAHVAGASLWYAIDLGAGGEDVTAIRPEVDPEASPTDLIAALHVAATVLGAVVRTTPDSARGFHPFGQADPSGFAAIVCDEMLVHTHDASRGLGVDFIPPQALATKVVTRLFPWVEGDEEPWTLLQFANGRIALPGRERRSKWKWHCAPLSEWDGTIP